LSWCYSGGWWTKLHWGRFSTRASVPPAISQCTGPSISGVTTGGLISAVQRKNESEIVQKLWFM
jgi:hypothetical protein